MNSKGFRRTHGSKTKSASSTFISLHFNKADEEQLEISYKDEKKETENSAKNSTEGSQSNSTFFVPEKRSFSSSESCYKKSTDKGEENINNDSDTKGGFDKNEKSGPNGKLSEETIKTKFSKSVENLKVVDSTSTLSSDSTDSELKLSPAIEAAELDDDSFNNYVNDELHRAKCEILDTKKDMSSSFTSLSHSKRDFQKESCSLPNLNPHTGIAADNVLEVKIPAKKSIVNEGSYFCNVTQEVISFLNFARNSVKFHVLIAVLACFCAPVPSWLSGFLVGTILSSSVVYWLYKPTKKKKNFYNLNNLMPRNLEVEKSLKDSDILKGWMNELPSFMNYSPDKYHVSCTRSVYVRLDGSYLRFSFPQKNVPKRAMFNEPRHEMQFIYQQHYDIADAVVELLPKGLANKRLWSKKYPICLRIPNSKEAVLFNSSKDDTLDASFSMKTNKKENSNKKFSPRINEYNEIVVYLFSRTDRDKNLWYNRFLKASKSKVTKLHSSVVSARITESDSTLEYKRAVSMDFAFLQSGSSVEMDQAFLCEDETDDGFVEVGLSKQQKFEMYMSALLSPLHAEHPLPLLKKEKKDGNDKQETKASSNQSNLMWLNTLIGRIFFDFLVEDVWAQLVTEKIQRKLNRIKLPFFLSELTVKDINLGSALPKIHQASSPSIDERGLWIDVDVSYNGSFHMTLETKLSLRRLKGDSEEFWDSISEVSKETESLEQSVKSSTCNSDEESMESSSDDESVLPEVNEDGSLKDCSLSSAGSRSGKLMKFVDRLAQSPYFQHAAKNKYIKKAMNDISNTPLVLTVEVQWLTGTLAVNIPSWPTDRLWYGFRTNPSLSITARPKLGQHVVTFTQVTEWIEKKLVSEFQKLLVMPNMDDLIIPIMQPYNDTVEA